MEQQSLDDSKEALLQGRYNPAASPVARRAWLHRRVIVLREQTPVDEAAVALTLERIDLLEKMMADSLPESCWDRR